MELVQTDGTDGLLAHSTLVGVTWGLVVVGVGDQACHATQDGEGFNFHVGVLGGEFVFVQGDQGVVLLVDVQVLNYTTFEEVCEVLKTEDQIVQVLLLKLGLATFNH